MGAVTASMVDSFPDANGDGLADKGETITYATTISNTTGAQINGVEFLDTPDANTTLVPGSIHASPVAFDDVYNWVGNTQLDTNARGLSSITSNDTAPTDSFTLNTSPVSGPSHGAVTLSANGHFVYTPAVGYSGDDSFTYTIANSADASLTSTGTVTIHMPVRVWYLLAGAAGDGRSNTPSGSPSAMSTAANLSTDVLYVFSSASTLNGGFTLDNSQQLLGQGVSLVANSITLFNAGSTPNVANNGGDAVTLALGNTLAGFNIANTTTGKGIVGSSVGALNVSSVSVSTQSTAVDLTGVSTPSVNVVLGSTTSTGGTNNVKLSGLGGTVNLGSGALSGASGDSFTVSSNAATITYSGSVTTSSARPVNISNGAAAGCGSITFQTGNITASSGSNGILVNNCSSGTISFSNPAVSLTTTTNNAVTLTNNNGATIGFTGGGLAISTTNGKGFTASGGGTVNVSGPTTGTNNTVSTTGTARALEIVGTSGTHFGGSQKWLSINKSGAIDKGIVVNFSDGSFTVTGDNDDNGTPDSATSGGTITGTTNRGAEFISVPGGVNLAGMTFTNATTVDGGTATECGIDLIGNDNTTCNAPVFLQQVGGSSTPGSPSSLKNITVNGSSQTGINIFTIRNLAMNGVTVSGAGNAVNEHGVVMKNLLGTSNSITSSSFTNNHSRQLYVINTVTESPTPTLSITSTTFSGSVDLQGALFDSYNSGDIVVNVGDDTVAGHNTFQNNFSNGLQQSIGQGGDMTINIKRNTFTNNNSAIVLQAAGVGATSTLNYSIWDNTSTTGANSGSGAIIVSGTQQHILSGDIRGNVIGNNNVGSGAVCGGACTGISVDHQGSAAGGRHDVTIIGNTIRHVDGLGLRVLIHKVAKGNVVITGNLIEDPDGSIVGQAMEVRAGTGLATDTACLTATIGGSVVPASWPSTTPNAQNQILGSWDPVAGNPHSEIFIWNRTPGSNTLNLPGGSAPFDTFVANNNNIPDATGPDVFILGTMSSGASCPLMLELTGVTTAHEVFPLVTAFDRSAPIRPFDLLATSKDRDIEVKGNASHSLLRSDLDGIVRAAIDRWTAAGLTKTQLATLRALKFEIADLSDSYLGEADGDHILVSRDAQGKGWFIDRTPEDDSEFGTAISTTHLFTNPFTGAAGHVDLLTAIEHEMGHKLGLNDSYAPRDRDSIMFGYLSPGERRLPYADQAKQGELSSKTAKHFLMLSANTGRERSERTSAVKPLKLVHHHAALPAVKLTSATRAAAVAPLVSPVDVLIGSLPAGKIVVVKFQVTVNNSLTPANATSVQTQGTVKVTGFTDTLTDDPAAGGATDPTTTQLGRTDLSVTSVTDGVTTTTPGSTLTYVISYSDPGRSATGVKLSETVPVGTTFNSGASSAGWSCTPNNNAGSTCTNTIGSLAHNATGTKNFAVTVNTPAAAGLNSIVDTASIADDGSYEADINTANDSATDNNTVLNAAPAFGTFTKSDGVTTTTPGSTLTYTIDYSNSGNQDATGVVLTETVPTGTAFVAAGSSVWTSCADGAAAGTMCTITVGNLAGGGSGSGSATFKVTVLNPAAAGLSNIVNNTSITDDGGNSVSPVTANASDTDTLTAVPDLSLAKTPDVTTASPNSTITYTLNYANSGNQGSTGVVITETVPANTSYNSAATPGWTCSPNGNAGNPCTKTIGSLAGGGGSGSTTFAVIVSNSVPSGTTITNVATIDDDHANGTDGNPGNNTTGNVNTPVCANPATVINTNDSGNGSLRQALSDVCDGGTINITATGAIQLLTALPDINKNLTINGPGANQLEVRGSQSGAGFRVFNIASGVTVSISALTVNNGSNAAGGGGVQNAGTLTLTNCAIGNASTTSGNVTTGSGGGILNSGTLNLNACTVSNNVATVSGGGIFNAATGTLTIKNSTISGNTSQGGANTGGGITNAGGTVTLINTTVGANLLGGGIFNAAGTTSLSNTLVADNTTATDADIAGTITSNDYNLIENQGTAVIVPAGHDQVGTSGAPLDAKLGVLANNGGPTFTQALLPGSPAIEAGLNTTATAAGLTFDQRGTGFPRFADSADADTTQTVDIGAYETHPTIEDIQDTSTNEDTIKTVTFNLGDDTGTLITGVGGSVTATSSNTTLVPNANLSFSGSGGSRNLQITPALSQNGTTTITVTVTATNGRTASDSFALTVNAVNDNPNANGETVGNIGEDCASGCSSGKYVIPFATLLSNDNAGPADEAGQTITITNVGSAVGGTATINGTNIEFTPTADFNGAASFQYTVTDNGTPPASANATASFTITEVNDAPTATDDPLSSVNEDSGLRTIPFTALTGNDSKGPANESAQTLTITNVTNAVGGTVSLNGINVEFTPAADFNGAASFDYSVQDNGTTNGVNDFKTATGHVTFTVTAIADTPSVTGSTTEEDVQTTTGLVISRNAADSNEVTHFKITNIANGSLFKNDGTTPISNNQFITFAEGNAGLKFTPTANFSGLGSFQVQAATDGAGGGLSTGSATAQITVGAVADVPSVTPATTSEDTQSSSGLVITKNVADGAEVTHFKITNILNGVLFKNDGATQITSGSFITVAEGGAGLKFTPANNLYSTVSSFSFDLAGATSAGGAGLGNTATASITVNPVADTPSVTNAATAINTQTTSGLVISRNVADAAEVTHFKITNITNGLLFQNDGTTPINNGDFISFAQANAGLKFTPGNNLSDPTPFGFDVQASLDNTSGGLGGGMAHALISVNCSSPQVVTSALDDGSAGTLRNAVLNLCPGGTITFNLPAGPQTISLGSSLFINKDTTITGPTSQSVTINGTGNRVLNVTSGNVNISNLTISGGSVSGNGGGLLNSSAGTLTLTGMLFTGNGATNGGAVASIAGTVNILNSTISGNSSTASGGGIYNQTGVLNLINVTITNNRSDSDNSGAENGGGIFRSSGTVTLKNTIVAGNFRGGAGNAADDISGSMNAASLNNLIGTGGAGGLSNGVNSNQVGVADARLAALASNGGPTQTHALKPGSLALDMGDNTTANNAGLITDQRGGLFGRIRDAASDADTTQTVDIGAFESDPSIEDISDKATSEDTALPSFSFNLGDSATAFDSITATSSNTSLVPNANINISGSGSTRNLGVAPASDQSGTTTITVTVSKTISGTAVSMSDIFVLTVGAVPDTPSVTNAATNEDTQSAAGLVITRNASDGPEVTNFKITNITGGTLFKNDGVTAITSNSFITVAEGGAGLKFTPAPNSTTAGSFQVQASLNNSNAGLGGGLATATITVTPVNDAPTLNAIGNLTIGEDATLQTVNLSGISAGGGENQTLTITATSSNSSIIPNPTVNYASPNATGALTFTPITNANGSATVTVTVNDGGGTTNGGVDSVARTFTVTVNSVNDAPAFTKGADQTVGENAGAQTVNNWATNISAGPSDELGQTLTFQVTNNTNPALFSVAPAITSNGTLTYTPAHMVAGTSQITVVLKDNGGTASGGVDTSMPQTFNITVTNAALISFSAANYNVDENGGSASLVVNRTGDSSIPVTVDYATSDNSGLGSGPCASMPAGQASSRCDYNSVFGTLRFAAGENQKTITVPITPDAFNEGSEFFTVALSNVSGPAAILTTPSTATVTISDSVPPAANPIDDTDTFVRQQYHDFLNREADPAGLAFWKDNIDKCNDSARRPAGLTVAQCIEVFRIHTSAAFFLSIEFRQTGGMVRDFYVAALDRPATNNMPSLVEFERDTQAVQAGVIVGQGSWQQQLNNNRAAFMSDFVMRAEFISLYPTTDAPAQYVDKLFLHSGLTPTAVERNAAIAEFGGAGTASDPAARGRALLDVTQNALFQSREMNRGFVQMQYFGYLRRNPNDPLDGNFDGFNFWVNKLNSFNGDFINAEMVKAFLSSAEYRRRFGL